MIVLSAFVFGLLFSIGLGIAGMTLPIKVLGFLDVSGAWDPSLAFVMAAAVSVTGLLFPLILQRRRPLLEAQFDLPKKTHLDARLLTGAALFGIGWGLAGYCPGPALVSLVTLATPAWIFVTAMFIGFFVAQR